MTLDNLTLDNIEYGFSVDFKGHRNVAVFCPYCEDTTSVSPSCSVSSEGLFKCHGKCGSSGTVFEFYGRVMGLLPHEAEEAIRAALPGQARPFQHRDVVYRSAIEKLDEQAVLDMIERSHIQLMSASDPSRRDRYRLYRKYLNEERGLDDRTLTVYEIGADEQRLTIPIYWADETPGIRQYLPNASKGRKIKYNPRATTATRVYPYRRWEQLQATQPDDGEFVILCEGEWDCLLLLQHGYNALTTTAGVTNWREEWYDLIASCLNGRPLVIIFDVNDKKDIGQRMAKLRATEFAKRGVSCFIVVLPVDIRGGDVTDFFIKCGRTKLDLDGLIWSAMQKDAVTIGTFTDEQMSVPPDDGDDDDDDEKPIGLIEALQHRGVDGEVTFQAQVVAKADAPYRVPCHFKVTWEGPGEDDAGAKVVKLKRDDPRLLALIGIESTKQIGLMKAWVGVPKSVRVSSSVEVYEYASIEELYISPVGTDMKGAEDRQVPPAYSIGLGIAPNVTYRMTGVLTPRPKDQHASFLIWKASVDGTDIDTFELDDGEVDAMSHIFQSTDVAGKMHDIATDHACCRTLVHGRPILHELIDLAYHSVLRFDYGNEKNVRGRLDIGIFGDTRTGKSQAAERLQQFYGVGSTMLCENKATASGIMGGVNRVNGSFVLKPGRIPLAHRRLLICDELNQLSKYEIGNLTGVRSSGEVRIEKIIHGVFPAETRLVWLSNPREEELESYCFGIEMVKDLIGDAADIARFDAVLIVSSRDVSRSTIQTAMRSDRAVARYTREPCQRLVLWAWSRRRDQVLFDTDAVDAVYNMSSRLVRFHPSIPLLLEAEARHKLARLAAAAAARVFSTDNGESLRVRRAHVEYAFNFINRLYELPACSYHEYSATRYAEEVMTDTSELERLVPRSAWPTFSQYVLSNRELSRDGLMIAAGIDYLTIFQFLHVLQKCGAIRSGPRSQYIRTKAFKNYLSRRLEADGNTDHVTQSEDT